MLQRFWDILQYKDAAPSDFGLRALRTLVRELLIFSRSTNRQLWTNDHMDSITKFTIDDLCFPKVVNIGERIGNGKYLVQGRTSAAALSQRLVQASYSYPKCFQKALSMSNRDDLVGDITAGLKEGTFYYFPDVDFRDIHYNNSVTWDEKRVLIVVHPTNEPSRLLAMAEDMTEKVKVDLVQRGIMSRSSVSKYLQHVQIFPWMEKVLARLKSTVEYATEETVLDIVTFVSSVALVEGSTFVKYDKVFDVMRSMTLSQDALIDLKILEQAIMLRLEQGAVHHLAKDIQHKIPPAPLATTTQRPPQLRIHQELNPVEEPVPGEDDNEEEVENIAKIAKDQPTGVAKKWSDKEKEIFSEVVGQLPSATLDVRYSRYQDKCVEARIKPRSKKALQLYLKRRADDKDIRDLHKAIAKDIVDHHASLKVGEKYAKYVDACEQLDIEPDTYFTFYKRLKKMS